MCDTLQNTYLMMTDWDEAQRWMTTGGNRPPNKEENRRGVVIISSNTFIHQRQVKYFAVGPLTNQRRMGHLKNLMGNNRTGGWGLSSQSQLLLRTLRRFVVKGCE